MKWSDSKHDGARYNQFCYDFDSTGSGAPSRQAALAMTFKGIGLISGLYFIIFKLWTRNQHCPEVWYYTKSFNTYIVTAIGACFVMFQYPIAVLINFFLIFQYGVMSPLIPQKDQGVAGVLKVIFTLAWVVTSMTVAFCLFFGTVIA